MYKNLQIFLCPFLFEDQLFQIEIFITMSIVSQIFFEIDLPEVDDFALSKVEDIFLEINNEKIEF